ncbi:MAG: triose-phosphate isomerase [Desulfovibrio sp.]
MKKLMAANWKMHKTYAEAQKTAEELVALVEGKLPADREMLVVPAAPSMKAVGDAFKGKAGMFSGAQNVYPADKGAFTGEISPEMIKDLDGEFVLTGHSERRHVLGESDEFVGEKTAFALNAGLKAVLCIGEKLEERKAGEVQKVCDTQMEAGLKDVSRDIDPEKIIIAYEPVWAIGTGEVAGPEEIVEAHGFVRAKLVEIFGNKASEIRILYGGSVKPANCAEIISLDNVDGVLVGGASLESESFSKIVLA